MLVSYSHSSGPLNCKAKTDQSRQPARPRSSHKEEMKSKGDWGNEALVREEGESFTSLDEIVQLGSRADTSIFDDGLCSDVHMMTRQQKVCVRMVLNILCMYVVRLYLSSFRRF